MRRYLLVLALALCAAAPAQYAWQEQAPMPTTPSGVFASVGACLAAVPAGSEPCIWAAKGNATFDAYLYHVQADTWKDRAPVPLGVESKPPGDGARAVSDNERYVYFIKGNNSLGFHRYDVLCDSWQQLMDVPLGVSNKDVKYGSDLVFVRSGGRDWVYLLKGYRNEFYRYDVAADSWQVLAQAPYGASVNYYAGCWLVYDGGSTVYCHRVRYQELWTFDVDSLAWDWPARTPMPTVNRQGRTTSSGRGGSAAWLDGSIYALKGNGTDELWRYLASTDSWYEVETIPSIRVGGGGDIAACGGMLYALKGNKCNEFWRFDPSASSVVESPDKVRLAPARLASPVRARCLDLAVPEGYTVELYDALGRQVDIGRPGGVRAGVYILRISGPGLQRAQPLVIVE